MAFFQSDPNRGDFKPFGGFGRDAHTQYDAYLEEQYALFVENYKSTCALVEDETFNVSYEANRYHYTLLYYDQSGNLTKTIPPKGVNPLTGAPLTNAKLFADGIGTAVYPTHSYVTSYKHNSLNQVIEVTAPDGGTSEFWYDNIGRLVVSQNARQEDFQKGLMTSSPGTGTAVPAYSYTRYDVLGRVYEVGEIIHPTAMTNTISKDPSALAAWLDEDVVVSEDVVRNNITLIYYDETYDQNAADEFAVTDGDLTTVAGYGHTRNRIVATAVIDGYVEHTGGTWIYPDPDYVNHYRYDIHGNVQSYLQEITVLGSPSVAEAYRRTDYEYDLISGNPTYIWYQKGKPDQYIHQYRYDEDNRLKEVYTSDDGQVWDRDVNYEYREDGYLARTELGEMKVQGMDYAYTLHGWIKTLNSGVLNANYDMGKDGKTNPTGEYDFYEDDIHALHARDVLNYTVGYYNGDYTQISAGVSGYGNMPVTIAGTLAADIDDLFNGNITSYIVGTTDETGAKLNPLATSYHYDQLHRFKESHVFTHATNIIANNTTADAVRANTAGPGGLGDYEMHVDYDMNGNILGLDRQAQSATNDMDEFTYNYLSNTNKLDYVTDAETGTGSSGYGDIQHGQATGNYLYHDDGSLKKDVDEEIEYIDWYPNGLVKRIYRTNTSTLSDLYFEYDPTGNRTLKVEMTRTSTTIDPAEDWLYTYYATDANGITMAVYEFNPDDTDPDVLTKKEMMLYGGSRLGMETTAEVVSGAVNYLTDCNNDGLASGIIQLGAITPTTGVVLEILLNNTVIADITWNTSNTIESHGESLVNEINADAVGYYAEMIDMGAYVYIRLKEITAGSLSGKTLMVELNNSQAPTYIKREFTIGECVENRILGMKFYELTNYLGNVMEVIADRKIAHDDPMSANVDYFEADVISYADYYPGGMEMPGRNGSLAEYRFKYNGMESDPEVSGEGNSYTTQFRQYDPRLMRWKSLDPLAGKYPEMSPYVAFNNNSNYYTDPLGLEGQGKGSNPPDEEKPKREKQKRFTWKVTVGKHDLDIDNFKGINIRIFKRSIHIGFVVLPKEPRIKKERDGIDWPEINIRLPRINLPCIEFCSVPVEINKRKWVQVSHVEQRTFQKDLINENGNPRAWWTYDDAADFATDRDLDYDYQTSGGDIKVEWDHNRLENLTTVTYNGITGVSRNLFSCVFKNSRKGLVRGTGTIRISGDGTSSRIDISMQLRDDLISQNRYSDDIFSFSVFERVKTPILTFRIYFPCRIYW